VHLSFGRYTLNFCFFLIRYSYNLRTSLVKCTSQNGWVEIIQLNYVFTFQIKISWLPDARRFQMATDGARHAEPFNEKT
jgi:hypothetical protein